jgi:lycopene cyclase domain-containing protein
VQNYYLFIDLFCIAGPLILSFDKRVAYFKNWPAVFVSIFFTCLLFIPVDVFFTKSMFWGFNEQYLTGKWLFGLPIEEILFFVAVPFACLFVYECVIYYFPKWIATLDEKLSIVHLLFFNALSISFALIYWDRFYSFTVALVAIFVVNFVSIVFRKHMAKAVLAFAFIILPFLLINGALTGSFTENEVVWYNAKTISQIRIFTIPIEDLFYNILLVSSSLFFYLGYKKLVLKSKSHKS